MLSSGSRASTPLKKEADGIRAKLEGLGEDAADVSVCVSVCVITVSLPAAERDGGGIGWCRVRRERGPGGRS